MNGNLIKRSHTIFGTIAVLFLVQLLAVQLEARDLVWQPHAAANQTVQATTFKSSTSRIEENARLLVNGKNRENATGPAVVALQAEIDENTANTSLEPIPVAHYHVQHLKARKKPKLLLKRVLMANLEDVRSIQRVRFIRRPIFNRSRSCNPGTRTSFTHPAVQRLAM